LEKSLNYVFSVFCLPSVFMVGVCVSRKVLVALGGNAILRRGEKGTAEKQLENIRVTCRHLVKLVVDGYGLIITHGNGPQVGAILLKNELSKTVLTPMPLDVCGAQSQGMIGYMLQQSMRNEMKKAAIEVPVVSLVTQTVVDEWDEAFENPRKPIGPFYCGSEAEVLRREKGWQMVEDSGRGYRRVVSSPEPKAIVEWEAIKRLFESGVVVIAAGGGGVPTVMGEDGSLRGVEAVIDKDLVAQMLANYVQADFLLMLTDVENVFLNYGKPSQVAIDRMSVAEARLYLQKGYFALGSMGPKVEAAIRFVETGGERAIIASLEKTVEALAGSAGTTIQGEG